MNLSVRLCWLIVLAAGWGLAGCTKAAAATPEPCPDYKIGVILSENTAEGTEQRTGYDFAASSSRIRSCAVTLVYQDEGSASDRETAQTAALELTRQGVVAIIGATSDQASMRVAGVARYLKVPLIIPLEASDRLAQDTNPWVFRVSPTQAMVADKTIEMLATNLGKTAKVAILFEKSDYGESAAVTAGQSVLARGLKMAAYIGYPTAALDKPALLRQLLAGAPNVLLIISSNPIQALEMLDYFKQMGGLIYIVGSGFGFYSEQFIYTPQTAELNDGLEGLILATVWNEDLPWQGIQEFNRDFYQFQRANRDADMAPATIRHVQAYVALRLLTDVMNGIQMPEEGLADIAAYRQSLADALSGLSIEKQIGSLMGYISFDPSGQSRAVPVLVQVQAGNLITVYPPDLAGENTVSPLP